MNIHDIIIKPIITESSMKIVPNGKYTFAVAKQATKEEIRKAVNQLFSVNVIAIATNIVKGKSKRTGPRRLELAKTVWKKAIVTVKKGEKIFVFEPGGEPEEKKK